MSDENPFETEFEEVEQYCWLDQSRPCDERCVAYDPNMGYDRGSCLLVNAFRKSANALGMIASFCRAAQQSQTLPPPPKVTI